MSGGAALEVFDDFVLATGPANLTGPESVINDATKNSPFLKHLLSGSSMSEMLQGGESIKDELFLQEVRNFKSYKPNARHNWTNPQVLSRWSIPWRFSMDHMSWTDQEIMLNSGDMSEAALFRKYKDMKKKLEMNLWTSFTNGLEEQCWAVPDPDEMEETDGLEPNSLFLFNNEFTDATDGDGLFPSYRNANGGPNTVQGLSPLRYPRWDNQRIDYGDVGLQSAATNRHLFEAFDRLYRQLRFERMPYKPEFSEPTSAPAFITASNNGISIYENSLRVNQDHFRWKGQDPAYPSASYKGVQMLYISELDSAAVYPTGAGSTLSTEDDVGGTTNQGPRYQFWNPRYLLKAIHRERYFFKKRPFSPSNQPWNHICPVDIWHNNCVRSRRRLGCVYPSADIPITV